MKDYDDQTFNGCSFMEELPPVISAKGNKRRIAKWQCHCGMTFIAAIGNVTSGQVKSCGCGKAAANAARCTKHGHSPITGGSRLYRFWQSMKDRCLNPNSSAYEHYGGRGIKMHEPWQTSFDAFRTFFNSKFGLDDIPDGLTMDRKDNGHGYEPNNLRFATSEVQANNRRNNRIVIYKGEKFTVAQLARIVGIKAPTLRARLDKQGLSVERAVL